MTASSPTTGPVPGAAITETHISTLVLIGDDAYKLKKPVRFAFADLTTRQARERLCHREVELNRRLAPDVYRGVLDVVGEDGRPVDHLVWMRRMPPDRRLSTVVRARDPRVPRWIDDVAIRLARFHSTAGRSPVIDRAGTPEQLAERWAENFAELRPFTSFLIDGATLDRAEHLATRFLAGCRPLLLDRIARGCICDGHGDLQADDIFCLDDGPRILDCIEFDDELRHADVCDDVAFLAMDLERIGAAPLAHQLVATYERAAGTTLPPALLHHYIAYRAQVRAKVACLRVSQIGTDAPEAAEATARARQLLDLCVHHLERARPRLVLVGGLPGTGKSTVARGIADALHAVTLRSDVVRKRLAGIGPLEHRDVELGTGLYDPATTERVYHAMCDRAAQELASGRTVVMDATFASARHRQEARRTAEATGALVVELRCAVDEREAQRRLEQRAAAGDDPSDATPAIARALATTFEPWPEAAELSTAGERSAVTGAAVELVGEPGRPGSTGASPSPAVPARAK